MNTIYLFDLDSTVTQEEILPKISETIGKGKELKEITERTMMGEIPFVESFTKRVELLKEIPVDVVSKMVEDIKLNPKIVDFLKGHPDNSFIVTSNLDVWINGLMRKIGMENRFFSSKADVKDNKIVKISNILAKESVVDKFNEFTVAIGDGSNDKKILEKAGIGIAFGAVRNVAPPLMEVADYAVYNEETACYLLNQIGG